VEFAMGAAGSDVAIETADVALLGDDLTKVKYTIKLSRKTFSKMKMNIGFSITWNVLGLTLPSLGLLAPILVAVLQEAGCVSVVINSSLLLPYKVQAHHGLTRTSGEVFSAVGALWQAFSHITRRNHQPCPISQLLRVEPI
jgi:hypothetical protein